MKRLRRSFRVKPSDPLLTTRWFDISVASLWFVYGVWGISAFLFQLASFSFVGAPDWYSAVWAGLVGLTSLIAAAAAASIFVDIEGVKQVTKKLVERDALAVFLALIFIYHAVLVWASVTGHHASFPSVFIAFSYYIIPGFRIYHLTRRIQILSTQP